MLRCTDYFESLTLKIKTFNRQACILRTAAGPPGRWPASSMLVRCANAINTNLQRSQQKPIIRSSTFLNDSCQLADKPIAIEIRRRPTISRALRLMAAPKRPLLERRMSHASGYEHRFFIIFFLIFFIIIVITASKSGISSHSRLADLDSPAETVQCCKTESKVATSKAD